WQEVVGDKAPGSTPGSGSGPHADSRDMVFDSMGKNLLEVDDGGIYKLNDAREATRQWTSLIGDLGPTEVIDAAYDPVQNTILAGAQDVGSFEQKSYGATTWAEAVQADGSFVRVDASDPNHPIHYFMRQQGGLAIETFDVAAGTSKVVDPSLLVQGAPIDPDTN